MDKLNIKMLDGFVIQSGDLAIDDGKNRTRKIWLLLAYLICNRDRTVSQTELYRLLWGDEEEKDDPQNALRVMLHRLRTLLDNLGKSAGRQLILRQKEGYRWNPQVQTELDAETFEALRMAGDAESDQEERMELYSKALKLYKSDFLFRLSGEQWVREQAVIYHDHYIETVRQQILLLDDRGCHEQITVLAADALKVEPFSENLYYHLISSYLALGKRQEAIEAYEQAREVFVSNFGTMPAEGLRRLYYEAVQETHINIIPIDELYDQIREKDPSRGALLCDYDFFITVFHSAARHIARSGSIVHLAVFTVRGKDGKNLPKRSMEYIMDCLLEQTRSNLRRGDTVTRCSVYQYAVLLQMANYENSCMVCERIIKAYNRKYPHSPAEISYAVKTVEGEI